MIIIRRYHPFKTEEKTLNENWIFLQKYNPHIFDMNQKIYILFFYLFTDARNARLRKHYDVTERTLHKILSSIYSPILTKEINTLQKLLRSLKRDED